MIDLLSLLAEGATMKKRNQINVTLEETELGNVNEYCRVHGITPVTPHVFAL